MISVALFVVPLVTVRRVGELRVRCVPVPSVSVQMRQFETPLYWCDKSIEFFTLCPVMKPELLRMTLCT